jgi:hypothetical protein
MGLGFHLIDGQPGEEFPALLALCFHFMHLFARTLSSICFEAATFACNGATGPFTYHVKLCRF